MMNVEGIPVWKDIGYQPALADVEDGAKSQLLIVGGGPIGLAMALDLGRRGHDIVVLNALPFIARGSKAICFSKRCLEIYDRLGVGDRLLEKGVSWDLGKVFWKDDPEPVYEFNLLPVRDQKFPAFINIQQYYVEEYLVDEIAKYPNIELRWRHEVTAVQTRPDGVTVTVDTPDGAYTLHTDYLIACDGNKSAVRNMLGLDFEGRLFEDNFLIADVVFKQERPTERWFCFEPPYPGWSSLIHKQPDGVWRLDFQLGWDIDKAEAVKPENVEPFVRGMLGDDIEFEFEWLSIYTFQCRRLGRFVHDRVIFAGDSAHLVSPFGARGCNGGMQDVDGLGWKIDRTVRGLSPASLLEAYNDEAVATADENILNSTRSTDFITPKTDVSRQFRDAVLELSRHQPLARPFVNSGRLSTPVSYPNSPLNAPSSEDFGTGPAPGDPCIDAPVTASEDDPWLLSHLGDTFTALVFGDDPAAANAVADALGEDVRVLRVISSGAPSPGVLVDGRGLAAERYAAQPGTVYLVRPDQVVVGRWRSPDARTLRGALARACGQQEG